MSNKLKRFTALPMTLLLVLGLISPSFLTAQSSMVAAAAAPAEWKFNMMNPGASEAGMEDWIHLYPSTATYSESIGYGVTDTAVINSRNRNVAELTSLENNFFLGANGFRVDLPNGLYDVTVYSGDATGSGTTNMTVTVDGNSKGRISAKTSVGSLTFQQEVTAGYLQLNFTGSLYLNGIIVNEVMPEIPQAPSSLEASATFTTISLSWEESTTEDVTYTVYRSISGEEQFTALAAGLVETGYQDASAQYGTSYDYYVTAQKNSYESEESNMVSSQLQAVTEAPQPPSTLTIRNVTSSGVSLQWSASELTDSYSLYRAESRDGSYSLVADELTQLTYLDNSADTSLQHFYKVTAVNSIGESGYSPIAQSTIYTPPGPLPTGFPYRFDIGLEQGASDYIHVNDQSIYSEELGYGFTSMANISWGANQDLDPLRNDYAIPAADTVFSVDLPNGDYRVSIIAGDSASASATGVIAERIQKVQIPEAATVGYMERSFEIALVDGQLSISFNGSAPKINSITIDKLAAKQPGVTPTVYLSGDSTVQTYDEYWKPEAGWGQMINRFFTDEVAFENHAIGGRSSKTFITEGRLDNILRIIRPGDYLMIQFGHNDATISVPERYASVPDYKEYLKTYINGTRQRGAEPLLVTPVGRRSFNEATGKFNVSFPEYVQGMKEVAAELNVKVVDLSALSIAFYDEIGFEATRSVFLHTDPGIYTAFPNGSTDDTHFQEYGAIQLARLVSGAIAELDLPISQYVVAAEAPDTVPNAPANVIVSGISNAGATVSWSAAEGADIYKVYRKQASEAQFSLVTTSTSPLASMTGMSDGTDYVIYVTAVNAKGESSPSAEISFKTKSADYKFDFQGGPTHTHAGTDAAGYSIVNLGASEATSTTYNEERGYGLLYDAGMITRNRGYGNYADQLPTEVLDALRDWIGYFNTGWQFRVDVPNGIYAIKLYVGDFGGSARTNLAINGTNYGAVNAANSSYIERVISNIQVTDGKLLFHFTGSTAIANALEITTILVAPSNLELEETSLDIDDPSITITWNEAADIAKYRVYRQVEGSSTRELVAEPTDTTWTDEDVIVGASYRYSVSAVDAGGIESVRTNELLVPLYDENIDSIDAPTNLSVVETNKNDVTIGWDAVAEAHAYAIYRAESEDGDYELVGFSNEASYTDYTVLTTIPYYFKVKALHGGIPSELSEFIETPAVTTLVRQMEALDRGLVAIHTDDGVFVSWRMLGTDPSTISFHLYRDGERITSEPITSSTNYLDPEGSLDSLYAVAQVIDGVEYAAFDVTTVWAQQYMDIPLNKPADGITPLGDPYSYSANDTSVADLDGDGEYEIIVKWNPSNAKDNSHAGYTGNVYIDAYKLSGEQLWRIDLGHNIRAGAHYTQFMVYDLDGDGKAELAVKTSDGTIDGTGGIIGERNKDYRNSSGYVIIGKEYLTIFDGATGAALDTVDYDPPRGVVNDWGDGYGNRVDRFAAAIAYLDGERPSLVMARGVYTRIALAAYNFRDGQLTQEWRFDTIDEGNQAYEGQGYHSLSVADVDQDGKDEIVYGQMVVNDNGKGLYSTGLGHGDALHVGSFIPDRDGLQIYAVQENIGAPYGYNMRDARTGEILWGVHTGIDTGRGLIADVDPRYPGAEAWAINGEWNSRVGGIHATTGEQISTAIPTSNFAIWWDGDLLRELLDHDYDASIGAGPGVIDKWDYENGQLERILTAEGTLSNNGTKGTPSLQADLLGDWREEVLWRTEDSTALRLYTTTDVTEHRIHTLMHDSQYRLAVAWQNVAYNQPPHPSFFIGEGMTTPPQPSIAVNAVASNSITIQSSSTELMVNNTLALKAMLTPAAATIKDVEWSVANKNGASTTVASINEHGMLTGNRAGEVVVTARTLDGSNLSNQLVIKVKGSSNTGNPAPQPTNTPSPSPSPSDELIIIKAQPNAKGIEQVIITTELLQQLANGQQAITVTLSDQSSKQLSLSFTPEVAAAWTALNAHGVTFNTPFGNIKLGAALVQSQQGSGSLDVLLESIPAPSGLQALEGHSLQLTVLYNGIELQQLTGGVTVSLTNITPQETSGDWVVYSVDENGELSPVKNSRLNSRNELTFKTHRPGQYAALFVPVSYPDVASNTPWAAQAITALAARGIVNGYSDGSFQPNRQITRAEFLKLLLQAYDLVKPDALSSFTDVSTTAWYYQAIASAEQLGLVTGKSNGQFAPNDEITREEMAVIAYRLIQSLQLQVQQGQSPSFSDEELISSYAADAVKAMQQGGILLGNGANQFKPNAQASRAEAAVIIYRLLQLQLN